MRQPTKAKFAWLALGVLALVALSMSIPVVSDGVIPWYRSRPYRPLIHTVALSARTDSTLLYALIWQESRFVPTCRGPCGEIGLMQVTTNAARDWARATRNSLPSERALQDPALNLRVGSWYLERALTRWSGQDDPTPYALAEYNAGLSNARRWAQIPGGQCATGFVESISYPTTKYYVREILRRYRRGY